MIVADNPAQFFENREASQVNDWFIRERDAGHEMPGMPVSGDATRIVAGGRA